MSAFVRLLPSVPGVKMRPQHGQASLKVQAVSKTRAASYHKHCTTFMHHQLHRLSFLVSRLSHICCSSSFRIWSFERDDVVLTLLDNPSTIQRRTDVFRPQTSGTSEPHSSINTGTQPTFISSYRFLTTARAKLPTNASLYCDEQ